MKAKKSILIVDDDIAHRTMLRVLLDRKYAIFEADDGSTAIEEVRSQHLDLVLMDVRMKNISGIEALDRIKALNPDVPVVMMTAYFSNELADQAREKGAVDYISKPFYLDELRKIIETAMDTGKTRQNAAIHLWTT